MKKIILLFISLLILTGCNNEEHTQERIYIDDTIIMDTYTDTNPIKIGIYKNKNLIKSYSTKLSNFKDIATFSIYYTQTDTLNSSNTKYNFKKYYNEYTNIDNYKTGFYISFEAEGKQIEQLILDPSAMYSMTPYLYVYLYDDVNQATGSYYSHLEKIDDNTIISSIKLFLAQQGSKISSPITLTAFTYDEDDITSDNKYRGKSSYTIIIETK